jgi:hypothetical protein
VLQSRFRTLKRRKRRKEQKEAADAQDNDTEDDLDLINDRKYATDDSRELSGAGKSIGRSLQDTDSEEEADARPMKRLKKIVLKTKN